MRNQKRIDVEKFSRVSWKHEQGVFTGRTEISRQPFGNFFIYFTLKPTSGETTVEIINYNYPVFNRPRVNYESFPAAVEAVAEYFEGIDERAKKVPQNVKERAKRASQYIIAQEIAKIAREVI